MSQVFTYISTKQTSDPYIPSATPNITVLARDVSDALYALQGGNLTVGKLAFFPIQRSVANHLLCNGQEVAKVSFPELYDYLGDTEGTPTDPANFVLPNYLTAITPAAVAAPETVEGGTVTSEASDAGTGQSGGSIDYAVDSGARYDFPPEFWIPF